ncbi:MAG: hypothetical protein EBQ96_00390 [Proteobacteria bacterium]|nr:hypothetical protein [Pseudomonadota bacterium]
MDTLLALIGPYYGLDWITMLIGTTASYFFSDQKLRLGFMLGIIACACAMVVAVMSHQTGFIVYNALLISINIRGLIKGDRRRKRREESLNLKKLEGANDDVTQLPEAVPVPVRAR